jgi:hypothetical protein
MSLPALTATGAALGVAPAQEGVTQSGFLNDVSSGDVLYRRMCRLGIFASPIGPGTP